MINQSLFIVDVDACIEIIELAMKNGKKQGESMQKEFDIILNKSPEKFTYIGDTDLDCDLLVGNLREKGLKILNFKEIERRQQNERL